MILRSYGPSIPALGQKQSVRGRNAGPSAFGGKAEASLEFIPSTFPDTHVSGPRRKSPTTNGRSRIHFTSYIVVCLFIFI